MLSDLRPADRRGGHEGLRLNAPFCARCFLTLQESNAVRRRRRGLNAPLCARCFLTNHLGGYFGMDVQS